MVVSEVRQILIENKYLFFKILNLENVAEQLFLLLKVPTVAIAVTHLFVHSTQDPNTNPPPS